MIQIDQEEIDQLIDFAADAVLYRDGVITAQAIYEHLQMLQKGWRVSDSNDREHQLARINGAIEDILQHSYHVMHQPV